MRLLLFASMLLLAAPAMAGPDEPDGGVAASTDTGQAFEAALATGPAVAVADLADVHFGIFAGDVADVAIAPAVADLAEAAVKPYAAPPRRRDREEGRPGDRAVWLNQGALVALVARLPADHVSPGWLKVNDPTLVDVGK